MSTIRSWRLGAPASCRHRRGVPDHEPAGSRRSQSRLLFPRRGWLYYMPCGRAQESWRVGGLMDIRQVTLFGGTGFIGRYVVRALAARGLRVRVAVRHPELAEFTRVAGDVGQIMAVRANLRFPQSVAAAVAGSDAVVNAAGIPYERGRQRYKAVHADGARH